MSSNVSKRSSGCSIGVAVKVVAAVGLEAVGVGAAVEE